MLDSKEIEKNLCSLTLSARAFLDRLGQWGGGGGEVPAAHNSKPIDGIERRFRRVVENHKLINLM